MNAQRPSNRFDSRMIRKPHRQPRFQRTAWGFVTLAFWGFYFYLWAPLVTLFSWLVGGRLAWQQLYERQSQFDPYVLVALPLMLLGASVLLIGWAEYNRARFRGHERRLPRPLASLNEVAADLGASTGLAERLMGCKAATLHMDDHARPVGIRREVV
ncbi:poly-beta-1,6-N-acetyl-D-glucosamine biosynthesis protein PgaD [Stenotrophomonas maltophilia]|uniref:poly-beta-1,6-N-acetyl-D-glucosamine biosynthesis protein PgaD n=1 Tax=Stenotrophomonas maltophilia TaxID=40324 RepID=UPI0021C63346|nr:poly-beta-1,6-N-acetyl-D-glucosamine biosynthesis protein PgaD [Stenotrophomonas maltophilia]MCU1056120.1 poly-beta-1,6-N-acetyl-D-glucosamine biosynthesis protein PgaD [Stenotrophomonas maltophilia]